MRSVNDMNEEKRLFGDSENDPRSPLFKGGDPCEYCCGTGKAQESCCGRPLNDYGICSDCGEHTYTLGDDCEECNNNY